MTGCLRLDVSPPLVPQSGKACWALVPPSVGSFTFPNLQLGHKADDRELGEKLELRGGSGQPCTCLHSPGQASRARRGGSLHMTAAASEVWGSQVTRKTSRVTGRCAQLSLVKQSSGESDHQQHATGRTWPKRGGTVGSQEAQREAKAEGPSTRSLVLSLQEGQVEAQRTNMPTLTHPHATLGGSPSAGHCSGHRQSGELRSIPLVAGGRQQAGKKHQSFSHMRRRSLGAS